MPAIGMGVFWFGYSLATWGYILVRGYPVKFTDWINPRHPYSGPWPPTGAIPGDEVFPGITTAGTAAEAGDPTAPPLGPPAKSGTPTPVPSGSGPVLQA